LLGLADDDHAQYLLATGARTGASAARQDFTLGVGAGNIRAVTNTIYKSAADSLLILAGGNASGSGGNIELYGQSHASVPSQIYYDAQQHTFRSVTGGTVFATINSSGDVGIGASPSTYQLYVYDNTTGRYAQHIKQDHASGFGLFIDNDNTIAALRVDCGGNTNVLRVDDGDVGINLATPQTVLHAEDTGGNGGFFHEALQIPDGSAITILTAGTIVRAGNYMWAIRTTTGTNYATNIGGSTLGGTNILITFGATNTVTLTTTAGGALTVQRTADDGTGFQYDLSIIGTYV
jgi:hypothetical protein